MKKILNYTIILTTLMFMYSCDTNNEVTGYVPAKYSSPAPFDLAISIATDTSFDFTYTPTQLGKGYYVVLPANMPAPTSTQVHNASANGILQSGNFDILDTNPIALTATNGIYGAYDYNVYAIHKSTDNFISEVVKIASVTTPDTIAPVFLGDSSDPAFQSGGINPFGVVTFNFTEPVYYQGGDITFTGFGSGRVITVNNPADISMSGTTISVNSHGTFAQDDFIVVSWADGTFKDNSGKNVVALSGFSHYFHTRLFTLPETAFLMQGTWNYSTVFYGGLGGLYSGNVGLFLPDTGQFELVLDPTDPDGLTLLGVNIFSPLNQISGLEQEPENLKIKLGVGGALEVVPNQTSAITAGGAATEWGPWSFFGTDFPGFYDLEGGTINHWLTLYVASSGSAIDDIDYNYSRVGTFGKPSANAIKNLEKRNELIKSKLQQNQTYENIEIDF